MLFVSAPLLVSGAREAFATVDPKLERVARSLGDTAWGSLSPRHAAARGARHPRRQHPRLGAERERVRLDRHPHLQPEGRQHPDLRPVHRVRAAGGRAGRGAAAHGGARRLRAGAPGRAEGAPVIRLDGLRRAGRPLRPGGHLVRGADWRLCPHHRAHRQRQDDAARRHRGPHAAARRPGVGTW